MGVPQFFHWLVSRFEGRILKDHSGETVNTQPEYLYLDFNCGIHPAAKQDGLETLEDMYQACCEYLETIVKQVKPTKMIYIAIDGVAPMAKMRQQRFRRFKAIQDKRERDAIDRKHHCWKKQKFDFNMISPGTEFMKGLTEKLQEFIRSGNGGGSSRWGNLEIVLDDASHPNEGEHKIMNHLRSSVKNDASVVIYGLDSDLIFLSMLQYRPNMYLFREKLFFGKKPESGDLDESDESSKFTYLDVGQLRQIVLSLMSPEMTLNQMIGMNLLKPKFNRNNGRSRSNGGGENSGSATVGSQLLNPKLDAVSRRRLIVDYVALSFVLGNDFLPHLPSLKIKEGGLNRVIECYKMVQEDYPGHYLVNEDLMGFHGKFFYRWLEKIVDYEDEDLQDHRENALQRVGNFKNSYRFRSTDQYERDLLVWEYVENQYKDTLLLGSPGWRSRYYCHYLGDDVSDLVQKVCYDYYEGLVWMLQYYHFGCPNWDWSYKHRVAPATCDLLSFLENYRHSHDQYEVQINFKDSQPVRPEEQLLLILPPQSSKLIENKSAAKLMTNMDSPLIGKYPINFKIDLQGHRYRWECYPILPPVDEKQVKQCVDVLKGEI